MYDQFIDLLGSPFSDYPFLTMFIVCLLVAMLFIQMLTIFASIFYRFGGWK